MSFTQFVRNPNIEPANVAKLMQMVFHARFRYLENVCNLARRVAWISVDYHLYFVAVDLNWPARTWCTLDRKISGTKSRKPLLAHAFFHGIFAAHRTYLIAGLRRAFAFF